MPAPTGTVLLVDDDLEILESMKDLLAMTFPTATILVAASGQEGLERLRTEAPDVIVSDYRMPGIDGVEFLRRSRERAPDAARLMMSAYADGDVAAAALRDADVALLVTKPFQMEYFVQMIGTLLKRRGFRPSPAS